MVSPYHNNSVILAGGENTNSSGSHIIELQISDFGNLTDHQWPFDFSISGGTLSYMAFNNIDDNKVYAITSNGKFYKSNNKGQSFTETTDGLTEATYLYGSKILCSNRNKDLIFIAGSGYDNSPIYISMNGGDSFADMQYNLPHTTIHDLEMDPKEQFLFAATEAGPYVFIFNESKWYDLSQGESPNQTYWSVEYSENNQTLRFATYGRGIWDLRLSHLSDIKEIIHDSSINIYPNPTSDIINVESVNFKFRQAQIVNAQGQIINRFEVTDKDIHNFDVSNYTNGVYYIIFESENNLVIKKFIKI